MPQAIATAALVLALAANPHAQAPGSAADSDRRDAFLAQLKRAVAADDRQAVTAMIRYPITVAIVPGLRVPFADPASVLERYDDIFNPPLRETIARAPAGTVLGNGEIAIEQIGGQFLITSINVPDSIIEPAAAPAPSADASRGSTARTQGPRRIAIRVGPRPTQIPGTLVRDVTDTFILYLPKGRLASIRLERVPSGLAAIRVVHARTGAPLGTRASADGRFVSGRPAEDGDYRVEVRRTLPPGSGQAGDADEGHLPYMLSLTLR